MDPARVESVAFTYVGVLFTGTAALLAWTQADLSWLVLYSTGPVFLGLGIYRLLYPDRVDDPPTEFGTRLTSILLLAALASGVVAFQLYAHFG